jgi:phosphoglycerate dehydrogenase-like enzyme
MKSPPTCERWARAGVAEDGRIRALREGRFRGAGLDVFETEPLPKESPLWGM